MTGSGLSEGGEVDCEERSVVTDEEVMANELVLSIVNRVDFEQGESSKVPSVSPTLKPKAVAVGSDPLSLLISEEVASAPDTEGSLSEVKEESDLAPATAEGSVTLSSSSGVGTIESDFGRLNLSSSVVEDVDELILPRECLGEDLENVTRYKRLVRLTINNAGSATCSFTDLLHCEVMI